MNGKIKSRNSAKKNNLLGRLDEEIVESSLLQILCLLVQLTKITKDNAERERIRKCRGRRRIRLHINC